jgi:CRISPR-associated protein Csb2
LKWLEALPPPEIVASKLALDGDEVRTLQVAMPHNSPADGDFSRHHPDLAPVYRATPIGNECLQVAFRWRSGDADFQQLAEHHLPALKDVAAKLRYLGRAEDQVESEVILQSTAHETPIAESNEIWRPSDGIEDVRLWTVRTNSTAELMQEFDRPRIEREAKRPARRCLLSQSYARDTATGLLPIHVAVFQIFRKTRNPDELPVVCDAPNAHRWRSPLRALACSLVKDRERWDEPNLAEELISGHLATGGRTQQPHLAYVPLPSLSAHGQADGRVRRFALLGYADANKASAAASIYRVLASCLDGEDIDEGDAFERGERRYRLQLIEDPWRKDKVWPLFAGSSQVWLSATPVALDRSYKVPSHSPDGQQLLSSNERHLRRLAEWSSLLRASLRHIRLPDDLTATCKITLTPSPVLPATERAERYRAKDERAPFLHARIEFPRRIRGPLLVGDRRYQGFGLFVPAE